MPDAERATLVEWLERGETEVRFVAVDGDGVAVGHVQLVDPALDTSGLGAWLTAYTDLSARPLLEVARLFVHPDHTEVGAGTALLGLATAYAHARGRDCALWVLHTQKAALRLYRRQGWVELGVCTTHPAGALHVFCHRDRSSAFPSDALKSVS